MNERIKELAKEAGVLADFGEDIKEGRYIISGSYQSMEKFAELIIRECASIDFYNLAGFGLYHHDRVHQVIKEHFGVEEDEDEDEDDKTCPKCGDSWGGTSCGADCGWITGAEE